MCKQQEEGDMDLNAATLDGFPSIEDVLNIPLSQCITFAANYCG